MKTKLISLGIACLFFLSSFAQGINFGVKAGASMNKITGKTFKEEFSFGYHAGGFVIIKLSKKIGIQPEVLFNQVNVDTSSNFSSVYQFNHINNIKLGYLSIPLLFNFNLALIYSIGIFYFQPQIYLDYYLQSTDTKKFTQIFNLNAGITF